MIYLDNNATTVLDPRVLEEMERMYREGPLNPSSAHGFGQRARGLWVRALEEIAAHFGVRVEELVVTSGATEALTMVLLGLPQVRHVVTSALEHTAVLRACALLEQRGACVTYLHPLEGRGAILPEQVEEALLPHTDLIVLSCANNETGVRCDVASVGRLAQERGIFFLVDGVAALGHERGPALVPLGVSGICFAGHKVHGPHGVGLAIIRKRKWGVPLIAGVQQRGMRGGTENLPGIWGFAKALSLLQEEPSVEALRNRLERGFYALYPEVRIHGEKEQRLPNTSNASFVGLDGEHLLMQLDLAGVAVSHGSACLSGSLEPSHVLRAMGLPHPQIRSSLRFSLSKFTTEWEIDETLKILGKIMST